jgi:hypothetical protein
MKQLLIVVLCFSMLYAKGQNTNRSKTTGVKELNIYGSNANFVGKLIINTSVKTNLFLLKSTQKKDTSNNYITKFYLGNRDTIPITGVKILMKFSKPVKAVMPSFSAAFNVINGISDDHISYIFKAGQLNRDAGSVIVISFTIKSKDKIATEISGLDGVLP